LLLASWPQDRNDPGPHSTPRALILSPTTERTIATLIGAHASSPPEVQSISLGSLLPPGSWQRVALNGGFAIVTDAGVFILDDWNRAAPLDLRHLKTEFVNASRLDRELSGLKQRIRKVADQLRPGANKGWYHWRQQGHVQEVAEIMLQLATLRGSATGISSNIDTRRIREAMDLQWAVDRRLAAMEQQVKTIATSLKALSDARMWRATLVFAVFGFAFALANTLAPPLAVLLHYWAMKGQVSPNSEHPNPYWWIAFVCISVVTSLGVILLTGGATPSAAKPTTAPDPEQRSH
jgi:hypothetical protein